MQVKFSINPRLHARFEDAEYKSLPNEQIEIKGCVPVSDLMVNITIKSTVKEIASDNANHYAFSSFDSVLKEYPQNLANILCELIADLDSRGESESTWFDFHFEMVEKIEGFGRVIISANGFDWVTYYNDLQSQKSSMIINSGGFWAMMSIKPN